MGSGSAAVRLSIRPETADLFHSAEGIKLDRTELAVDDLAGGNDERSQQGDDLIAQQGRIVRVDQNWEAQPMLGEERRDWLGCGNGASVVLGILGSVRPIRPVR